MRTRKKQRIIIGTLCSILVGLAIGYAVLSQQLNIQGTGSVLSNFQILFTKIEEGTMNGAKTIQKEIVGDTTANFIIDLKSPGSTGEYIITVENRGNIDAYVKDIKGVVDSNKKEPKDIQFSVDGLKVNDKLKARETKTFKVKVNWSSNSTSIPETSKDLSLTIDFVQDTNQVTTGGNITELVQDLLETSPDGTYEYMGGTYLREIQDSNYSNYIWFDGFLWRIMGINEDGSIRMVTEESITTIPWGKEKTGNNYDDSYANDWLNNYFYPKLKDKDLLINSTWCSEVSEDRWSTRTTCTNNLSKIQRPIGLLSVDEVNRARYLNFKPQEFTTLTPTSGNGIYYSNLYGTGGSASSLAVGIRPVINIKPDIDLISGEGTRVNPFIYEDRSATGKLNDHSLIGEYVTYAGRNYRVLETSSQGTKLILDGYYDSNNDGTIEEADKMAYGENCTLCTTINEDSFINWISNNNEIDKNKLVSTTWYRGDYWTDRNYKTNLESTSNPYVGRVGLIRIGEVLAAQSETMLSKGHTVNDSQDNIHEYWTLSFESDTFAYVAPISLELFYSSVTNQYAVRPVIMISPDVQILGGNGTFNSPFQI